MLFCMANCYRPGRKLANHQPKHGHGCSILPQHNLAQQPAASNTSSATGVSSDGQYSALSQTHAGGRGQRMVRGESSRASVASITACTPPGATANSLCCLRSRPSSAACQELHRLFACRTWIVR